MTSTLAGKRILVTRSRKQASRLASELEERGAIPIIMPTTDIVEPDDLGPLDQALKNLSDFDWVVFTSSNAVESVVRRMSHLGLSTEMLRERKLAVVGPATAAVLKRVVRAPDLVPPTFVASAIGKSMGDLRGQKVLLPRGNLARADLPCALNAAGATVLEVIAYCAIPLEQECGLTLSDRPDAITFASAESARTAVEKLRQARIQDWLTEVPLVCIGPVTAESIIGMGLTPARVADEFTIPGLVSALEELFREPALA